MQKIYFNLDSTNNLFSAVAKFSNYNTDTDTELDIHYTCGNFVVNDVYLVISAFVNEIRAKGHSVNISFKIPNDCDTMNYASRIDFFKQIGLDFEENFNRHEQGKNLIPITNAPAKSYNVSGMFEKIFSKDFGLNEMEVYNVGFVMDEIICNATIHSEAKSGAYYYCQKFLNRNHLEITVVDSGVGIAKTLSKQKPGLTNDVYLFDALNFGVTSGEGRGHGLYFISEFIKMNLGEMILLSGPNVLKIEKGNVNIYTTPNWNGVILKLIINFDVKNSIEQLVEETYNKQNNEKRCN